MALSPSSPRSPAVAVVVFLGMTVVCGVSCKARSSALEKLGPPILPTRPASHRYTLLEMPTLSLKAHHQGAFSVDVSRDGKWIASGGGDGIAKVWDASTGAEVASIQGGGDRIFAVAFTPDGQRVASPAGSRVWVWDRVTRVPNPSFEADSKLVAQVAVSPNARYIATTGMADRSVHLWDLETGASVRTFAPEPAKMQIALRFSRDGKGIASAGEDRMLHVWNVDDGAVVGNFAGHTSTVDSISFLADGTIGTTGDDRTLRFWRRDGSSAGVFSDHGDEVWSSAASPTSGLVASGGKDGMIRVWDSASRTMRWQFQDGSRGSTSLAFFPDDSAVAAAQTNGLVNVWSLPGARSATLPPTPTFTEAPALGPSPTPAVRCARAKALVDAYGGVEASLSEAEQLAHDALHTKADFAPAYVVLAQSAYRRGYVSGRNYEKSSLASASSLINNAIALDPSLPSAHVTHGWILRGTGDAKKARAEAETADAATQGHSAGAHVLLAQLAADDDGSPDDATEAILQATRALAASPTRGEAWLAYEAMAYGYGVRGDMAAANLAFQAAEAALPDSAWPVGNYALFLYQTGDYAHAIDEAKRALAKRDYAAGHTVLASAESEQGNSFLWDQDRPDDARASFEAAIAASANSADGHYGLGACWRQSAIVHKDLSLMDKSHQEMALAAAAGSKMALDAIAQEKDVAAYYAGRTP